MAPNDYVPTHTLPAGAQLLPSNGVNKSTPMASYWRFVLAGLTKHATTGALIPSQKFLIEKMIAPIPPDYSGRVLELGAGTGALTLRLATRCPLAQILACEINPVVADDLKRRSASARLEGRVDIVTGSAQGLLSTLKNAGANKPAYIISGIPLGNLDRDKTAMLIDSIADALPDGGIYIQFQHSLIDRTTIQARLPVIRTVPVWLNFPPAFIYYAQK